MRYKVHSVLTTGEEFSDTREEMPLLVRLIISPAEGQPEEPKEVEAYMWQTGTNEEMTISFKGFTKPHEGRVVTFEGSYGPGDHLDELNASAEIPALVPA